MNAVSSETSLTKLARVLTGERVDVLIGANGPRIEGLKLILPEGADDDALTGCLDLLAARFSYSDANALSRIDAPVEQRLAQLIDDRRAASQLLVRYPGARRYLARWRTHLLHDTARQWHDLAWRDKLLWLIERALWNEASAVSEVSLRATLDTCASQIDAARRVRSTSESIEASRALVAMVRALAGGHINTMMFTADADDTLDAEHIASEAALTEAALTEAPESPSTEDAAPAKPYDTDEAGRPRLSVPITTAFDRVIDMTGKGRQNAWRKLQSLARDETAPLKTRLERALRADEQTHWRREQERGVLDRQALVRLAISPGYRTPFRVQRMKKGRDAAVSILVDRSGSMTGKKIELARLCAAALADALQQLAFSCEVLGYSSVDSPEMHAQYEAMLARGDDLHRYNRFVERLDLVVYKRFGSSRLDGLSAIECGHENPDGEALAWAAQRLLAQRARRHILMVLSDGFPATGDGHPVVLRNDLHERVRQIAHEGIELIGVGILDDAVEQFYPQHIVVNKLHELPERAFNVLASMLLNR
jgi:nitric oxide reductase activation protein